MTTLFKDNQTDCAGLSHTPADWTDAELQVALAAGLPGAETELSTRLAMKRLRLRDRAAITPSWENTKRAETPPQTAGTKA